MTTPPRPWIGFNVDDAATHIKLESKEEGAGGQRPSAGGGPAAAVFGGGGLLPGGGSGGKVGRGRKGASSFKSGTVKVAEAGAGYDPAAWAPQCSAAASLPSLVRR